MDNSEVVKYLVTRSEVVGDQELPLGYESNMAELLLRLNKFRLKYGKPMHVTSGYRSPEHNAAIGGAPNSNHCLGMACDFADADRQIANYILSNPSVLVDCDLYAEAFEKTTNWVHLQTKMPVSGRRIFMP